MSVIQSLKETSAKATTQGEHYLEKSKRYYELKIFQQITLVLSSFAKLALIGGLLFLALIFGLIATTIALGNHFDNMAMGALIVSFVLIILSITLFFLRKTIDKKIIRKVGNEFFEE